MSKNKTRALPRQFPTKGRARMFGKLRLSLSYGYPGKNGIAVGFCWNPQPRHDVPVTYSSTGSYTFNWSQVATVIADAE